MWFSIWPHPTYHHPCQCHLQVSPLSVQKRAGSINPLFPALLYGNINQRRRPQEERVASIKCVFERDSHGRRHKEERVGVKSRAVLSHADKCCSTQIRRHLIKRSARCHSWGDISPEFNHDIIPLYGLVLFVFITDNPALSQNTVYSSFQSGPQPLFVNVFMFKPCVNPNTFQNNALLQKSTITPENQCLDLKLIMTESLKGKCGGDGITN